MVYDRLIKQHQHQRKMLYQNLAEYPHPDKLKRFVDKLVYFASVFGIIMTIPQIWIIWVDKNASGISVISWISYWIIGMIWLFYGIIHKEKPLIIVNSLWFFLHIMIIVGAILYG